MLSSRGKTFRHDNRIIRESLARQVRVGTEFVIEPYGFSRRIARGDISAA